MAERNLLSARELSSTDELGEDRIGMVRGSSCGGFVKASRGGVCLESVFLKFASLGTSDVCSLFFARPIVFQAVSFWDDFCFFSGLNEFLAW